MLAFEATLIPLASPKVSCAKKSMFRPFPALTRSKASEVGVKPPGLRPLKASVGLRCRVKALRDVGRGWFPPSTSTESFYRELALFCNNLSDCVQEREDTEYTSFQDEDASAVLASRSDAVRCQRRFRGSLR